jgi:hypothetical protein
VQRQQSFLISSGAIENTPFYFHPGVREERRRTVTNNQTSVNAVTSEQADGADGSLQAQDWLPVKARRKQDGIADRLFKFRGSCPGCNGLLLQLRQNATGA